VKLNKQTELKIRKYYRLSLICYLAPFLLPILGLLMHYLSLKIIDDDISTISFLLILYILFPSCCVGLFFNIKGISISKQQNNYQKKVIGYQNLLFGAPILFIGFLCYSLLLLVSF
jgi:hypothetical protein